MLFAAAKRTESLDRGASQGFSPQHLGEKSESYDSFNESLIVSLEQGICRPVC